jgi:hypothetical protein
MSDPDRHESNRLIYAAYHGKSAVMVAILFSAPFLIAGVLVEAYLLGPDPMIMTRKGDVPLTGWTWWVSVAVVGIALIGAPVGLPIGVAWLPRIALRPSHLFLFWKGKLEWKDVAEAHWSLAGGRRLQIQHAGTRLAIPIPDADAAAVEEAFRTFGRWRD